MCHTVLNTPCCLQWVQRSRLHDLSHLDCSNTSQHSSFNQAAFACCVRPHCLLLALECNDNALPRMQTRQISELRCASALGLRLCTSLELMTCLLCVNISCLLLCVRSEPARSPLLSVVPERLCADMPCIAPSNIVAHVVAHISVRKAHYACHKFAFTAMLLMSQHSQQRPSNSLQHCVCHAVYTPVLCASAHMSATAVSRHECRPAISGAGMHLNAEYC
jgi:hypothetical protein